MLSTIPPFCLALLNSLFRYRYFVGFGANTVLVTVFAAVLVTRCGRNSANAIPADNDHMMKIIIVILVMLLIIFVNLVMFVILYKYNILYCGGGRYACGSIPDIPVLVFRTCWSSNASIHQG